MRQTITRKGSFDAAHRVMNEKFKCFNIHGHTYLYELTFQFVQLQEIGYAIDFKEIKRVMCQWIDDVLDHAVILNPMDSKMIAVAKALNSKLWVMSLNQGEYCNPTVENIAKEVYLAMKYLCVKSQVKIVNVRLWETPNCFTDCDERAITQMDLNNFGIFRGKEIREYGDAKGEMNYSDL